MPRSEQLHYKYDMEIAMIKKIIFFLIISIGSANLWAISNKVLETEKIYFKFAISKYATKRQGGRTANIYVKFSYKHALPPEKYVDYRLMRADVLKYMEPTKELPAELYWEIIAAKIGRVLKNKYPLDGVSVQIEILDDKNPDNTEPGDHGPIVTLGDIEPIDANNG